mmetsp:Transcript_14049/g.15525  ORF Transcript_14049/g.15525 Transcript_14049/m.15525 type:complete len:485 (-) Transcript_14049:112-1566(-)
MFICAREAFLVLILAVSLINAIKVLGPDEDLEDEKDQAFGDGNKYGDARKELEDLGHEIESTNRITTTRLNRNDMFISGVIKIENDLGEILSWVRDGNLAVLICDKKGQSYCQELESEGIEAFDTCAEILDPMMMTIKCEDKKELYTSNEAPGHPLMKDLVSFIGFRIKKDVVEFTVQGPHTVLGRNEGGGAIVVLVPKGKGYLVLMGDALSLQDDGLKQGSNPRNFLRNLADYAAFIDIIPPTTLPPTPLPPTIQPTTLPPTTLPPIAQGSTRAPTNPPTTMSPTVSPTAIPTTQPTMSTTAPTTASIIILDNFTIQPNQTTVNGDFAILSNSTISLGAEAVVTVQGCLVAVDGNLDVTLDSVPEDGETVDLIQYTCHESTFNQINVVQNDTCKNVVIKEQTYSDSSLSVVFGVTDACSSNSSGSGSLKWWAYFLMLLALLIVVVAFIVAYTLSETVRRIISPFSKGSTRLHEKSEDDSSQSV